jgi:hypothetical protein
MSFLHPRGGTLIEALEQRIAPALLVTGANLLGGSGNPTTGETSVGGNSVTLVKVLSGDAIVWFNHGAIDAISVGPNTSLDITGDVGTIIGNLTAGGKLTDSDNNAANGLDGDVLLPNNITAITTHPLSNQAGSIGNIITGGSVSNLNISGNLEGVYAGDAVFRAESHVSGGGSAIIHLGVDVNPILPGLQSTFTFVPGNAKVVESGASISNVKVGAAEELQLFAGSGFSGLTGKPGSPGGSISNVTVTSAFVDSGLPSSTPSYYLLAGDGGHGSTGGAGGSISKVIELSSTGVVKIIAGQGGYGTSGGGGSGGSIKGVDAQSDSASYTVLGGQGGAGAPGGAGGSVVGVNFAGNSPSSGIIVHAPFTGGSSDDLLLVDTGTGNMVIEQNTGSGFTPVIQDNFIQLKTIAGVGTTPVAAIAVDVNGDGLPDIVVAYKNTSNLGVYINQGNGVFYTENFAGGNYIGDTLDATSVALPFAPSKLAAGNFTGDSSNDLAVIANTGQLSELLTLTGDGKGDFAVPTTFIPLGANAVDLTPADIQGQTYSDLLVGFKAGAVFSLLANGSTTGAPFTVVNGGFTVVGGIANLDYNFQTDQLLALNGSGTAVTIYSTNSAGALTLDSTIPLTGQPGLPLVAHFVPELATTAEPIQVLSSISTGARLDTYTSGSTGYVLSGSTQSTEPLKNFVPVFEGSSDGVAALGGSLGHFSFSESGGSFTDVSLPFSGKTVSLHGGDGGAGIDFAKHAPGKGGAGGSVSLMNIQAGDISVQGGDGGSSQNGFAGAGGLVSDSPVLITASGKGVQTIIAADNSLLVAAGVGGSASGLAKTASGGAGGAVSGLNLSMQAGNIQVASGDGGSGAGGAGGNAGSVIGLKSLDFEGNLTVDAGQGGSGVAGKGGAGGGILNLSHQLTLPSVVPIDVPYDVTLTAGAGGASADMPGGPGGSVTGVTLVLAPSNESVTTNAGGGSLHANLDSTLRVSVTAGAGGDGSLGGLGGSLKAINTTAVYSQVVVLLGPLGQPEVFPQVNPVTAQFTSGNGGKGTKGVGGAGGGVSALALTGISRFDPDITPTQQPLVIVSGNGGDGSTKGGAGGAIAGVLAQNAEFSATVNGVSGGSVLNTTELSGATVISGHGGNGGSSDGGSGGSIGTLNIGVQGYTQPGVLTNGGTDFLSGGEMNIQSGAGGNGGASGKGGAGGLIANSSLGAVDTYLDYGLLVQSGPGGSGGAAGGTGGNVTGLQLNAPENPMQSGTGLDNTRDTLSSLIMAGNGGAATGASAIGGTGGTISQISESKDANSSINLLQAGNGGAAVARGGLGGSVTGINTAGLIGQASDDNGNSFGAFQTNATGLVQTMFPGGVPEGVFAGRGGAGATAGLPGSVMSINAAQISAIGAAVDSNGFFAAAEKVANIAAESIAYDVNGNGHYDNATGTNQTAPDTAVAIDGFIFSETMPTGINTGNNALLNTFTFIA